MIMEGCQGKPQISIVEGNFSEFITEAERMPVAKIKAAWSNEILCAQSGRSEPVPVEAERRLIVHMKHVIHDFQSFFAVQRRRRNTQPLEVVHQVDLNSFQTGLCFLDISRFDTESNVFRFHQAIVALGQLILKHFGVFLADIVKAVISVRDNNRLLEVFRSGSQVQK